MKLFSVLADILYVGHSLVGPDLPGVVENGLRAMEQPATVAAQIINGAPLKFNFDHSAEAEGVDSRVELQKGETEVLILTEAIPLAEHLRWNDTPGQIARFASLAKAMNGSVRVLLYETWHSRKSGPDTLTEGDPNSGLPWRDRLTADLPRWQDAVDQANAILGAEIVDLLPAGQAMALLSDAIDAGTVPDVDTIEEFFSDDIHLSEKGEYFVALVHLAAITGKSPEGLPTKLTRSWRTRDGVVSDALAARLQEIAWQSVAAYQERRLEAAALKTQQASTVASGVDPTADASKAVTPTPITNPNLALGLNGIADWSVQQPFLNVLKTAREWTGHLPNQFGGWNHQMLSEGGYLDANGWPRSIPAELTGLSLLVLTDLPADAAGMAGRYQLTYTGRGEIAVSGRATNVDQAQGKISFDFTPGPGTVSIDLTVTDPKDPVRDMVMVREDRAAQLATGQIFNPDWLDRIRGVKTIRFMDWMKTNDSTLAELSDRPKVSDYTWSLKGAPVEVMIALANELDANPWFTMPHLASDELIRFYAETVHSQLAPNLNAHVEFSNEVWNWQFQQSAWAESLGRARWGGESKWVQAYALRASQMADIWSEVYGEDASTRLTRVIATQTGWIGLEDQILNAPDILAEGAPAPASHFDAYAVTGYFSGLLGSDDKRPLVEDWLDGAMASAIAAADAAGLEGEPRDNYIAHHRFDAAVPLAIAEIDHAASSGDRADTLERLVAEVLPHHSKVAREHGLRLVMYEGGTHVVGYGGAVEDQRLTDFFVHLNYTPEMAALYAKLMKRWSDLTPEPFNAFVDVAVPSKWGSWGALRHLGDENPRWQALAKGCFPC